MRLDFTDVFDGLEAGILGEGQGDFFESVGECAHGVLLDSADLIGGCLDFNRAGELGSTTTGDDFVVLDHVADNAECVVEATSGFVADCLGTSSD